MPARYDPLPRSSSEEFDLDLDIDDGGFKRRRPRAHSCYSSLSFIFALLRKARRVCRPSYALLAFAILLTVQVTLNTSYMNPPPFDVPADESVYIAANIVDADLIDGAWGQSLLDLVDLIGPDKAFVSIYGGPAESLKALEAKLPCEKSIVSEKAEPIDLGQLPHTQLYTSTPRIKRIAFLAEARNRALKPLDSTTRRFDRVLFLNDVFFNPNDAVRLLWGTNVNEKSGRAEYRAACGADFITSWKYYDTFATRDTEGFSMGLPVFPWFSGGGAATSRSDVLEEKSAVRVKSCWGGIVAFDGRFFQPSETEKLSRDGDGEADSDTDIVTPQTGQRDKTPPPPSPGKAIAPVSLPVRFRAVAEPYWEASECCLVHADLAAVEAPSPSWGKGIFMNPYVRVSYDATSFSRLWIAHRFERLFVLPQRLVSHFAGLPWPNFRRLEVEGGVYTDRLWAPKEDAQRRGEEEEGSDDNTRTPERNNNNTISSQPRIAPRSNYHWDPSDFWHREGHFVSHERTAERGGYCGVRALLVLREGSWEHGNWEVFDSAIPPTETEF